VEVNKLRIAVKNLADENERLSSELRNFEGIHQKRNKDKITMKKLLVKIDKLKKKLKHPHIEYIELP
jgi:predicted RNase H-like nuclease (RuvC/YqgF family)